jgi:hypothetical protein
MNVETVRPLVVGEDVTLKTRIISAEEATMPSVGEEGIKGDGYMVTLEGWGEGKTSGRGVRGVWTVWIGRDAVEKGK